MDPEPDCDDLPGLDVSDAYLAVEELYEELADYNECAARSEEEGWFYADGD